MSKIERFGKSKLTSGIFVQVREDDLSALETENDSLKCCANCLFYDSEDLEQCDFDATILIWEKCDNWQPREQEK